MIELQFVNIIFGFGTGINGAGVLCVIRKSVGNKNMRVFGMTLAIQYPIILMKIKMMLINLNIVKESVER